MLAKRTVILFIFSLMIFCFTELFGEDPLAKGYQLMEDGKYEDAILFFEGQIDNDDYSQYSYYQLSLAHMYLRNLMNPSIIWIY